MNIIDLKLLTSIAQQLRKARRMIYDSISVFDGFFLVVLISDFNQFALVQERAFWGNPIRENEVYEKSF